MLKTAIICLFCCGALLVMPAIAAAGALLDLPELEALTLDHSPLIKQAYAGRDAARARVTQARSGFWPWLGGQANIRNNRNSANNTESRQSEEAGLNLSQTLFDYSLWFGSKSAGLQSLAFDEDVRVVHNNVLTQVRQAYFAVRIAEKLLEVAGEAQKDTEAFRDKVGMMLASGLVPQLDLARAEYDLAEATRKVIEAKASLRKQFARLALTVGLDQVYGASLNGEVVAREQVFSLSEEELLDMALKFRPEIKRFDYLAQASEAAIEQARGGHFPVLSFQGNWGRFGQHRLDQEAHNYGLYLDVPLFQGFRVEGFVGEYQALHRLALQELAQMRLNAREQTHVAYQDLQETLAKVEVSQNQVSTAEENWRLMESRYQAGLATPLELSEARTNRFSAIAQLASDRIMVLSALAALDRAAGGALFPFAHQRQDSFTYQYQNSGFEP